MNSILAGMRVIESSAFIAAPYAGMMLAQSGAQVIRVDMPGGGLDYRRWPVTEDGHSLYWHGLNKAKQSICIDVRKSEGRELLSRLVCAPGEENGIFLTNLPLQSPLDMAGLRQQRADVIVASIIGSRSGANAVDYTVNAASGFPMMTGPAGHGGPVNSVIPAWDLLAGASTAFGVLAAVLHRRACGEGQLLQLALEDIALGTVGHLGYIAEAQLQGAERPRLGNDIYGSFGRDFRTRDGELLMITAFTPKQWQSLLNATGMSERATALAAALGLDFSKEGDRYRGRAPISMLLEQWVGERSADQVEQAFAGKGVCYGWYRTVLDLVRRDSRCSEANPLFSTVQQPGLGAYLMPGSAIDFEASARRPSAPAPVLGADTDRVLQEVLGMSSVQVKGLREREVVAGPTA